MKMFHVLNDNNTPERLKGKKVEVTLDETEKGGKLEFKIDVDAELDAQESGYLRWYVGELVDKLEAKIMENNPDTKVSFGLQEYSCKKI